LKYFALLLAVFLLSSACVPATPAITPQLLNIYSTSAAHPWLSDAYHCAPTALVLNVSDPASAQLTLRLGEPAHLTTPAYQIGQDDILVIIHPQVGVSSVTTEQARQIFSGQVTNWKELGGNDLPVQVWTFSPGEDVQDVFDQSIMHGQPVTSLARLAVSAQAMSDSVGAAPGSIGFLPRRWKAGNTREALIVATVPVLVIANNPPAGPILDLLTCLQSGK
jgi:hypothetical protein